MSVLSHDESFIAFLERYWPRGQRAAEVEATDEGRAESTDCDRPKSVGRFQILRRLGSGGFATVYLAYDPQLDQEVALKVPHPETARSVDLRRRFEREARAAAGLDHPNINPVHETSHSDAAELYIASHYCAGRTLADWLKRRLATVSPRSAARLVADLARAVQHAHDRGILHRDLKPSNVLLEPVGQSLATGPALDTFEGFVPRLCDFGLAKIQQEAIEDDRTRTGTLVGTPRYMAPEQAIGDAARIGPASDVYALGVILYELLVGRPPFIGDTELETLRQIRSDEAISTRRLQPKVPRDIDTIVLKCLEKEPRRRYQSASELAADLERFVGDVPIVARPKSLARRTHLWTRRHPIQAIVLLAGLLVALGLPAGLTWHSVRLERALRVADEQRIKAEEFEARSRQSERAAVSNAANVEQLVYAADMRLANQLLKEGEFTAAAGLIDRHDPASAGGVDRRGFEWWYFRPFREMARRTWQAHTAELSLLSFSDNGEVLLTASNTDGRARTWHVSTGKPMAEVAIQSASDLGDHRAGALSPDGKLAATVVARNTVAVWSAESGRIEVQLKHTDRVRCVTFSPDGSRLLTGGDDATRIWRCGEWQKPERELVPTRVARYSPDGRTLAIVWAPAFASSVHLLSAGSLQEQREITSWYPILDFAYSPDGRMLGTVSDGPDGTVISMYNPSTGAWTGNAHWRGDRLHGVSFSASGRLLATVAQDGGVRFWSTANGQPKDGLRGAGGRITEFVFSPDGRWLATSAGGAVSLWDQTLIGGPRPLEGEAPCAAPVVFSPIENRVAVARTDGSLLLVDAKTSEVEFCLRGHLDPIADIAFSSNGRQVASVDGRHLRVWSVDDGKALWQAEASGSKCVCWSADGDTLSTGGTDRLLRLWDVAGHTPRATFEGHTAAVLGVRFTADGKRLISYGQENAVRTWDIATGKQVGSPVVTEVPLTGLAVLDKGPVVAIQSLKGESTLWRFNAIGSLEQFGPVFEWPKGFVPWFLNQPRSLIFLPDGKQLGRAGPGDIFSAEDTATGARLYALGGRGIAPTSIAYSPDGLILAAVGRGNELTFWNTSTWHGRRVFGAPLPAIRGLVFSRDSRTLVIASDGSPDVEERGYGGFPGAPNVRIPLGAGPSTKSARPPHDRDYVPWQTTSDSLRLWDVESSREQSPLEAADTLTMLPSVAWTHGRNLLAAAARDGSLWVWDMNRRAIVARRFLDDRIEREIEFASSKIPALIPQSVLARSGVRTLLAFSPDGTRLATVDRNGGVRLWDTDNWATVAILPDKAKSPVSLCFSPDGATLVVTSISQARLYDVRTAQFRRFLRTEDEPIVLCSCFSPDGKTLALGTAGGSVQCYDAASGDTMATLVGHVDGVGSLAYSPDGRTLATGGWDMSVRLWDVASGREVAVLEGHRGRVHALAFSPDGSTLASGAEIEGGLGEVHLWRGRRARLSTEHGSSND